jgi:hypothetical protein
MTAFTAADGEVAAGRLATEQQALVKSLINLKNHFGRKLLDSHTVAGMTLQRRVDVLDGVVMLWTRYKRYRTLVVWVRMIIVRFRPTHAELPEVEERVTCATKSLAPDNYTGGRIEDLTLEQWYLRARGLLRHAPCDLATAAIAVADHHQDAINTTAASEDLA